MLRYLFVVRSGPDSDESGISGCAVQCRHDILLLERHCSGISKWLMMLAKLVLWQNDDGRITSGIVCLYRLDQRCDILLDDRCGERAYVAEKNITLSIDQ